MKQTCVNCLIVEEAPGGFWYLNNYFGLFGNYCANCYAKVSHDGNGDPKYPTEYLMILLKQESKDGKAKKA